MYAATTPKDDQLPRLEEYHVFVSSALRSFAGSSKDAARVTLPANQSCRSLGNLAPLPRRCPCSHLNTTIQVYPIGYDHTSRNGPRYGSETAYAAIRNYLPPEARSGSSGL